MNWTRLKNNKCPECNELLKGGHNNYVCTSMGCSFRIGKEKFEKLVQDLYKPKRQKTFDENLGELNNLDRPEITEDYSDRSHLDN